MILFIAGFFMEGRVVPLILFDIDGTLLDGAGAGRRAMNRAARQLHGCSELPPIPLAGRTDRAIFGEVLEYLGCDVEQAYAAFRRCYLSHLEHELADPGCAPRLLPGVSHWLQSLVAEPGFRLGLITGNCRPAAFLKLQKTGIDRFFQKGGFGDWTVCRTEVARGAVREFHDEVRVPDDPVVILGDTIHDIRCAREAGTWSLAVATGGSGIPDLAGMEPDLLLESLEQISPQVFCEWVRNRSGNPPVPS